MNGRTVKAWKSVFEAFDTKMLPGGDILGSRKGEKLITGDCNIA